VAVGTLTAAVLGFFEPIPTLKQVESEQLGLEVADGYSFGAIADGCLVDRSHG
jgi:hypothetical protein